MSDSQRLSRGQDYLGNITRMLGDLQGVGTVIHELIQNADDAPGATRMSFTVREDALEVWNDGLFARCSDVTLPECELLQTEGHRCDFHSFRTIGSGDKRERPGTTGAFGIGFTSVYQLTDRPELLSNGEHWIVDEMESHDDRILRVRESPIPDGTTFMLPWASEQSQFRERVRQEPVTSEVIASFPSTLRLVVPGAMPFLKKLSRIEVRVDDATSVFETRKSDSELALISDGEVVQRWFLLSGDFHDDAQRMKKDHPRSVESARSSVVTIALSLDESPKLGHLSATLPTEDSAHLPLLINADFFPASDRKRIRFDDDPGSEWNRLAIAAAADLLASNLADLPLAIGDQQFVGLVSAARDLGSRAARGETESAFGEFWRLTSVALPSSAVVPLEGGGRDTPRRARLWKEPAEVEGVGVLRSLDIGLVERTVKDAWYGLRSNELGIENLHLKHLVDGLKDRRVTVPWSPVSPAGAFAIAKSDLAALWSLIDTLLSIGDRSNLEARDALRTCAIAPAKDGLVRRLDAVFRVDDDTECMLADVGWNGPLLDLGQLQSKWTRLVDLVVTASPATVLGWLEDALGKDSASTKQGRSNALRWLHRHRDDLEGEERRIARLPIFPTAKGSRPLTDLALAGHFKDELGLALIVQLDGIEELEHYMEDLGARRLSLASYCTDMLAGAIKAEDLSAIRREKAVRMIARGLSEIRDDSSVRMALRPLPLVRCLDGDWRPGDEVYLPNADIAVLVGPDAAVADLPTIDRSAHSDLYGWLGAVTEPRPTDLVARCRDLAQRMDRIIAEALIQYAMKQFARDSDQAKVDLAGMREHRWLPTSGRTQGSMPDEVYLRFRRSLFASQARFIEIALSVERESSDFLQWLGLRYEPEPGQVVRHLLYSAENETPVGKDMWSYLNDHADDPALGLLRNAKCLLLRESGRYVSPREVYWGSHPFGRWRHQLAPSFSDFRNLLDRLGVLETPTPDDAVEVLLDIGSDHSGEEAPLFSEDVLVVRACWHLLSSALMAGEVTVNLDELANAEVVLDEGEWLRKPSDLYFRDSVTLANRFGRPVRGRLIDRPEGLWKALERAGVQNLSDAVTTDIVEETLLDGEGTVTERLLQSRRRLVVRVLSHECDEAVIRLDGFEDSVHLQRLGNLQVRHTVEVAGAEYTSSSFERGAMYLSDGPQFRWVEDGSNEPNWLEVAREFLRALGVSADVALGVASVLRGVLGAHSHDVARRELDDLGYPALDEWDPIRAQPNVAQGLGGLAPESGEAAQRHGQDEAGEDNAASPADNPPEQRVATDQGAEEGGSGTEGSTASGKTRNGQRDSEALSSQRGRIEGQADLPDSNLEPRTPPRARQSKLRSYVTTAGTSGQPSAVTSLISEVDRCAIEAVLEYERERGRVPEEMAHGHPGFDVRSEGATGEVRHIEVKGSAVRWGEKGVAISSRQYLEGAKRREDFWLYVVDHAVADPRVHAIQDPVSKIDQYLFDDGWRIVSEKSDVVRPSLPPLRLPTSPHGLTGPVPFRDPVAALEPAGWLPITSASWRDDWFAVRITGDAAGLKYRGGIAIIQPLLEEPEADDRVLVSLTNRVDPDTESTVTIRLWGPELNADGTLRRIRLTADGGASPLSVEARTDVDVLGEVILMVDTLELEGLGCLPQSVSDDG